ncbi:hypothetical protein [Methanosphaera sp.]
MATKTQTLYDTTLFIDGVPIFWSTEIEFTGEYEAEKEKTHSGTMTKTNSQPGCSIDITKYTKFNASQENALLAAIDKLAVEGGTVTMVVREPASSFVINAYGVRPDEESYSNNPGEFLETSLSLQGESFERYFV